MRPAGPGDAQEEGKSGNHQSSHPGSLTAIDAWRYLSDHRDVLWEQGGEHARLVALALLIAVPAAVLLGTATFSRPRLSAATPLIPPGVTFEMATSWFGRNRSTRTTS